MLEPIVFTEIGDTLVVRDPLITDEDAIFPDGYTIIGQHKATGGPIHLVRSGDHYNRLVCQEICLSVPVCIKATTYGGLREYFGKEVKRADRARSLLSV